MCTLLPIGVLGTTLVCMNELPPPWDPIVHDISQDYDSINYLWDWPFLLAFVRRRSIQVKPPAAGKFENYDWPQLGQNLELQKI